MLIDKFVDLEEKITFVKIDVERAELLKGVKKPTEMQT